MKTKYIFITIALLLMFSTAGLPAQRNRITARVDNSRRVLLHGHVHPLARAEYDRGRAESSLSLPRLTLILKPSDSQQAELDQLLAEQQDPTSPNYHHWLQPEEFADRFGSSQDDVDKMVTWLQSQNFSVTSVARARNAIAFTGDAAEVERAFGAEIHRYLVDGKMHFANASEPSVPASFQPVVRGLRGLHDFRLKPHVIEPQPAYNSATSSNHYLAPDDLATIYNIRSLYNSGIDGTGQKLVVVGQTRVNLSDIQQFRTNYNLPANDPQIVLVPDTRDPGTVRGDLQEADLDLEWAGAIARNATIVYVYSLDVIDAAQYAIDQNLAPVLSMSYGQCEAQTSSADAATLQSWAKQGNAQGMTWFAASGDAGATDCYDGSPRSPTGVSVDLPAAIPEVTGVGGTQLSEAGGNYWNIANDANQASALSYIPEVAWNDSTTGSPASSGGGASTFFSKPSWQTGPGVPDDNARDVPDVALPASPGHDGYLFITGGRTQVVGGTSAGAPAFAGIAALLNHYLVSGGKQAQAGLGNINPTLYGLAAAAGVFHDITTGDNMVTPCSGRFRNCTASPVGFSTGAGYDQVTGLGSVDAYNLVTAWPSNPTPTQ